MGQKVAKLSITQSEIVRFRSNLV